MSMNITIPALEFVINHKPLDGVYKAGFATSQQAYEDAVVTLFNSLDRLENILSGREYLVGDQPTEADVRLFVTMVSTPLVLVGAALIPCKL